MSKLDRFIQAVTKLCNADHRDDLAGRVYVQDLDREYNRRQRDQDAPKRRKTSTKKRRRLVVIGK